ncbi:MAG: universal stress protein [Phycisphaerales bacterium]|nr:universal stress protein [Phycisphaerales bacterium]
MYRYKRLMIGLNLTDEDKSTIEYAAMISRMAQSESIRFVHVVSNPDIPEALLTEYPGLANVGSEHARARMTELVAAHFDGHPDAEIVYKVIKGSPLFELLRLASQKDVDLILVGRKPAERIGGALAEKLARKAPCSVLIVPDGFEARIKKILIPVDYSEHSAQAMDVATAFASSRGLPDISCLHAYRVPIGYGKTGKTYEEFGKVMKTHAERDYKTFIRECDLKEISVSPSFLLADRPADGIRKVIEEQKSDLVVIGARGRSAAAAVLLGSVTERLIQTTEVPLLAVKKKGAGMGLLEALLNL